MKINKNLTACNYTCYKNKINKYIVIHYTANNGDTAYGNTVYFKSTYRGASAHYFVDDCSKWQCVEDYNAAWHCGANKYYCDCRNSNSIGIELCSRKKSNGEYYFTKETIMNAVELTVYLMKKYNIPLSNVIRHYDVTRKECPRPFVRDEKQWADFLKQVQKQIKIEEDEEMIKELVDTYGENAVRKALVKLIETVNDDGNPASWAEPELKEAIKEGLTDGTNPEMFATRQEVALMVHRALNK